MHIYAQIDIRCCTDKYVLFVNISNQDDTDLNYYTEVQNMFEKAFFNSYAFGSCR